MGFTSPQSGRGGSGAVCSGRAGGRGANKISSISPIVVCVPVAERQNRNIQPPRWSSSRRDASASIRRKGSTGRCWRPSERGWDVLCCFPVGTWRWKPLRIQLPLWIWHIFDRAITYSTGKREVIGNRDETSTQCETWKFLRISTMNCSNKIK